MDIARIARHLFTTDRHVARVFPRITLDAIEAAIKASEASHVGEIRFAVEGALDGEPLFKGQTARDRAVEVLCAQHGRDLRGASPRPSWPQQGKRSATARG